MTQWISTCKEVGGPSSVDLEYCLNQDTGCKAIKKGYCKFDQEHVLQSIAGQFSPANCQVCNRCHILLCHVYTFSKYDFLK